jgi:glycosyltransferase involved in cell wall biosynthesis
MPTVSVIIPAYNAAQYLGQAVESVLSQTFSDFEIILVDDGSTDNTKDVVNSFADNRLRYIYQVNKGRTGARNTGIYHATGKYVAFLDSDDRYLPQKLELQAKHLNSTPELDFVASGHTFIDEAGIPLHSSRPWTVRPLLTLDTWLLGCPAIVNAILVRREWLLKLNGFDEKLQRAEDWDLWLRLAHARCNMDWIKEIVCCYRMHSGQSVRDAVLQKEGMIAVLDKFYSRDDLSEKVIASKQYYYAQAFLRAAGREYGTGQVADASSDLSQAIALWPALVDDEGKTLLESLIGWAHDPVVGNPFAYLDRLFKNLPGSAKCLSKYKRQAVAQVSLRLFFQAHSQSRITDIRRFGVMAFINHPAYLSNLGVISIFLEAWFGPKVMEKVRAVARKIYR